MNEASNNRKRFRVSYILTTNPNELRKDVEALSEDFAREEVRQFLVPLYGRHGFKLTRIERLEVSKIVKN
jgi:hypothetical protein